MKNILLLTNIYPTNDKSYTGTPVCHYFTKEWVKMGYNVRVVHFESLFPKPFLWLGSMFTDFIKAKTGCVVYPNMPSKDVCYEVDGIPVHFVPIKKLIPHSNYKEKDVLKAFKRICDALEKENFVPDVITAHFALPQLQVLYLFKQKYPGIKNCLVLHSGGEALPSIYPQWKEYMDVVDTWGFRSVAFKNQFEQLYGVRPSEFLCYSGIPDNYIQPISRDFSKGVHRFAFVGSLFKLKRVEDTLAALNETMSEKEYVFDIVGDGAEMNNLKSMVESLKMKEHVVFHGQQPRDVAQDIVAKSDCFIMVSTREAFGLVYLEAMAKGCITVATKGQGIDGIIVDGENGFLCESENVEALSALIRRITTLDVTELKRISDNAVATAANLTNQKVAEHYLKSIL